MKSINSIDNEEIYPVMINASDYSVFASDNLTFISNSSGDSLLVDDELVEEN